jgi:hypothetical protein
VGVDDLAGADSIVGQVVDVGSGIGFEYDEVGVEAFFNAIFSCGFEIRSRIGGEGGEDFVSRKSTMHEFDLERGVENFDEADIDAEENGAAVCGKNSQLVSAAIHDDRGIDRKRALA